MPAKTRVFRFDEDEQGSPKQNPAELGWWIRDVPSYSRCDAVADARHLLCWGTDDGVFMYDFAAGRWLDPIDLGSADDAQHTEEVAISDICCTPDYLLVGIGGLYFVLAFSDLKFWEERWGREIFYAEKVIPVDGAGGRYQNLLLAPAEHGEPGVDLISVRPYEIRRTYRLPPDLPLPGDYSLDRFDAFDGLVIAHTGWTNLAYQLAWDLETGRLVNLVTPRRGEDYWGSLLNDHYLHSDNVLVEVPSFRPIHKFRVIYLYTILEARGTPNGLLTSLYNSFRAIISDNPTGQALLNHLRSAIKGYLSGSLTLDQFYSLLTRAQEGFNIYELPGIFT